jgi:peptidoglycan/LPS O-acetylase OafA/YrhL
MTIPDLHPAQLWQRDQTNCLRGIAALLILVFHVLIEWNMPRYVNLTGSVAVAGSVALSGAFATALPMRHQLAGNISCPPLCD